MPSKPYTDWRVKILHVAPEETARGARELGPQLRYDLIPLSLRIVR